MTKNTPPNTHFTDGDMKKSIDRYNERDLLGKSEGAGFDRKETERRHARNKEASKSRRKNR